MYCSKSEEDVNEETIKGDKKLGKNHERTIMLMVQKKEEHYLKVFKEIEMGCLGGLTALGVIWPLWTLYRKMYAEFFTLMGISFVFGYVDENLGTWTGLLIMIFMIVCGRKLYYQSLLRKIERLGITGINIEENPEITKKVKQSGGTTYTGIVIYLGFYLAIYLLLILTLIKLI